MRGEVRREMRGEIRGDVEDDEGAVTPLRQPNDPFDLPSTALFPQCSERAMASHTRSCDSSSALLASSSCAM